MSYVFWYKMACLAVGLTITCLGYLLFIKGVFKDSGNVEGAYKDYKLIVKKAAPGTYFVLFGSIIISMVVFKGLTMEEMAKYKPQEQIPMADSSFTFKDSIKIKKAI